MSHQELTMACKQGDLETVKRLVEQGLDVQAYNNRAIRSASEGGHLEVVKFLYEKGADIQAKNNFALRWASCFGDLELVKFLVEKGADVQAKDNDAIRSASESGHLEVVKFLYEKGADVQARDNYAVQLANFKGHYEVVEFLLEKGADETLVAEEILDYISFRKKMQEKRRVRAANKIGSWWIPICYRLTDENGELRMAVRSWKRLEAMMCEAFETGKKIYFLGKDVSEL